MSELTSAAGIVALAALALALAALGVGIALSVRLGRVRAAQLVVLGEREGRDLVEHAAALERRVGELSRQQDGASEAAAGRLERAERHLERALSRSSVVRYDAYGEMSGRQSSSVAILDERADGVLLSSILHREQARFYAKRVRGGESELGVSPEEQQAIEEALAERRGDTDAERAAQRER